MDEAEKIAEEALILRLLVGLHEDKDGRPITSYVDPDSSEGKKALAALARQVREGTLSYLARDQLALALDPETPSPIPGNKPICRIKFERVDKGNPPTWARDEIIAHWIDIWLWKNNSSKAGAAIHAATSHFRIGRSRLYEIWQQYKERFFVVR
jgi:hypothetical protein